MIIYSKKKITRNFKLFSRQIKINDLILISDIGLVSIIRETPKCTDITINCTQFNCSIEGTVIEIISKYNI